MRANLFMFSDENETSFIKTFGNRNGVIKEKTICSVVNIAMYPALIQSIAIIPISQQNQQIGNQAKKNNFESVKFCWTRYAIVISNVIYKQRLQFTQLRYDHIIITNDN